MGLSVGMGGDVAYYERDADEECEPARLKRREVDLHDQRERASDYYSGDVKAGRELAGQWRGPGAAGLGLRGKVTSWQLHKLYGEHIDPVTEATLGRRPKNFRSPEERLAERLAKEPLASPERVREIEMSVSPKTQHNRNFFDLTFSLPKSYSLLHAALLVAGRDAEAQQLIDAHHYAIDQCMQVLMDEAGYSKKGHWGRNRQGVQTGERIDAHDYVYSYFDHRTSRAGDPQLHTHVLLNNKVLCADGVWRSLDSDTIFKMSRSTGALHERFMAERTAHTMGLQHRARADGFGWEVQGIEQRDMDLFSSRRRAMEPVIADLVARYVERHGHEPGPKAMDQISQDAALLTRPAKPHDKTYEEYVADWVERYGRERGEHLVSILDRVPMGTEREPVSHGVYDRSQVLQMAIARCEEKKPTWKRTDLRQALSDLLPPNLGQLTADELVPYLDSLVDEAVGSERVMSLHRPPAVEVPGSLTLTDGTSVYQRPLHERFTTTQRLKNEHGLAALATRRDGPRLTPAHARGLTDGSGLYDDQAHVIHEALTRGSRLLFVESIAGSGKTYTIGKLAQYWPAAFGTDVVGVAKANNAAEVMREAGVPNAFNFDTLRSAHEALDRDDLSEKARETILAKYGLKSGSLLIADEVSMFSDAELFWMKDFAEEHGISMLWVGDRGQLSTVGTNVALDVIAKASPPLEMNTARRQHAEWERDASVGLHDGNPAAIAQYAAHGRFESGTREQVNEAFVRTLAADLLLDRDALGMTPTVELAAEYGSYVQRALIDAGKVDPSQGFVPLRDGTAAHVGDRVQARLTTKQIEGAAFGVGASNRDSWLVKGFGPDYVLIAKRDGEEIEVPRPYFLEHTQLDYVTTAHAKQGRTAARSYGLVTDSTDWNAIYVELTRGAELNVLFVPVEHEDGVAIETAEQVLVKIAMRREPEMSATDAQQFELELPTHMATLGPIYENEMVKHTRANHEEILASVMDPTDFARLQAEDADGLYRLTRALEREGHNIEDLLAQIVSQRELQTADEVSWVLHWRLTRAAGAVPPGDVVQGRYVDVVPEGNSPELQYLRAVAEVLDTRTEVLGQRQADAAEEWAVRHLGPVPEDPLERAEWAERAGRVAAYREQYGVEDQERPIGDAPGRAAAEQRAAWEQSYVALGRPAQSEDVARLSDGELLLDIDQYQRREAWMPPSVGERLETTSKAARDYETRAALDRAAGRLNDAERGERMAGRMQARVEDLAEIHAARVMAERFYEHEYQAATKAKLEYDSRHPVPDDGVQPEQEETPHRDFLMADALERARQVTMEIEAERATQEAERQREEEQEHSHDEQGHGY